MEIVNNQKWIEAQIWSIITYYESKDLHLCVSNLNIVIFRDSLIRLGIVMILVERKPDERWGLLPNDWLPKFLRHTDCIYLRRTTHTFMLYVHYSALVLSHMPRVHPIATLILYLTHTLICVWAPGETLTHNLNPT